MLILGIESSCDETSAAVVEELDGTVRARSNIVASQIDTHRLYGGVVPEIASRAHIEAICPTVSRALDEAGVTPEALLSDGSAVAFFLSPESAESKYMTIDLSVPKFDVSADTDLSGALRALGVTDVFDAGKADFSPLTDKADGIFLSQAKHAARVTIDEEGVVAAAYTVMVACGAALPPDERIEFTLDRPFLFAVTGESGEILFAGIVNTPA